GKTFRFQTLDVPGLPGADVTPPRLLSSSPTNGTSTVNPNAQILLVFSEQLSSSASITANYRLTTSGGALAPATATVSGSSVVLGFTQPLLVDTSYTLFLLPGLKDRAGNSLEPTNPIGFKTILVDGQPGDRVAPTVRTINPGDTATNVGIQSEIYITFSESMDAVALASRGNYQFTTSGGSYPVTPTAAASNAVRLTPRLPLLGNTNYTLVLTSGLTDLQRNPLVPQAIGFLTAAVPGTSGSDVDPPRLVSSSPSAGSTQVDPNSQILLVFSEELGAAAANRANYRVSTAEGVTSPSSVTVNGSSVTLGFGAAGLLVDTSYTISMLNLADKAGNPLQNVNPITFKTVYIPGKPGDKQSPSIQTISPNPGSQVDIYSEIFIVYSKAMGASAFSTASYSLTTQGGPYSFTATRLTSSSIKLTPKLPLLGGQQYRLNLSSAIQDTVGNSIAPVSVDFQSTSVPGVPGSDITPPILLGSQPANGAPDVDPYAQLVLQFSEEMGPSALVEANYVLTTESSGAIPVTTAVAFGSSIVLQFANPLPVDTNLSLQISSNIKDKAGNPLVPATPILLHTRQVNGLPGDKTPPQISSINPSQGSTVGIRTEIYVTFSEPVEITAASSTASYGITTNGGPYPVTNVTRLNSTTYRIQPRQPLIGGVTYTVVPSTDIRDPQGNPLQPGRYEFSTVSVAGEAGSDITPPILYASNPTDGAINIDTQTHIFLTFSEPVAGGVTSTSNYRITSDAASFVPRAVTLTQVPPNSVELDPGQLVGNTRYTVVLSNAITDKAGNPLVPQAIGFQTAPIIGTGGDTQPPQVSQTNPARNSVSVSTGTSITVVFSERVNTVVPTGLRNTPATGLYSCLNPDNYDFFSQYGNVGIVSVQPAPFPPNAVILTPRTLPLRGATLHSLLPSNRILDIAGNGLVTDLIQFTTVDQTGEGPGDTTAPYLLSSNPADTTTVINLNTSVVFTFSEAMNEGVFTGPVPITANSVTNTGNWLVFSSVDDSFPPDNRVEQPVQSLDPLTVPANSYRVHWLLGDPVLPSPNAHYFFEISNRIQDKAGNFMTAKQVRFTNGRPPQKPVVRSTGVDASPVLTRTNQITVIFDQDVVAPGGPGATAPCFSVLGEATDLTGTGAHEQIQIAGVVPDFAPDATAASSFVVTLSTPSYAGIDNFRLVKGGSYILTVKDFKSRAAAGGLSMAPYSKAFKAANQ
ncbi:MAG: Ig-like domain-containing protein, partial [Candidatus Riflebacteria bacterium]|nr:Ig-like domain-containing protein [Candidatus Riflebacteria bacterium]